MTLPPGRESEAAGTSGRDAPEFTPKDAPLRADVNLLGSLIGEMLAEQGGAELFELVEGCRQLAVARRAGDTQGTELMERLEGLEPALAEELVRGFSAYFQVVNLAEKVHRIRRRRDWLREASGPHQPGSLADAAQRICDSDTIGGAVSLRELFSRVRVEPVFTAHPTEATRQAILRKEQRIARLLVDRLDPARTVPEEKAFVERIRAEVTAAWQTLEHPSERPTVEDEREHALFFLAEILYRVIPALEEAVQEAVEGAIERTYGRDGESPGAGSDLDFSQDPPVRFASWVGGDMDGNPNVHDGTIRETLARHREVILGLYRREVGQLARELTQSLGRVEVDEALLARGEEYVQAFPRAAARIRPRHRDMPYRVFLSLVAARLDATLARDAGAYPTPAAFFADLDLVTSSLRAHRGQRAGLFAVERLARRVRVFRFHLATLDVRQDALVHRRAVARLLHDETWLDRSAAQRFSTLRGLLEGAGRDGSRLEGSADDAGGLPLVASDESSEDVACRRTLDVFRAVADCLEEYGPGAIGPFIISMTEGADDIASVLVLARWSRNGDASSGSAPQLEHELDVAPLFETVDDLVAAPRILRDLFAWPWYREHLRNRSNRQVVMVGYSDSSKDGGVAASRWALHRAQAEVLEVAAEFDIRVVFFHGRGGTVGRGGGKAHRAVLAAPRGSVAAGLRVTEQGEVIGDRYGLRGIAERELERSVGAVALALAGIGAGSGSPELDAIGEQLAADSRAAYRALVWDHEDFVPYFRAATPIDVIERMRIGSRPASRRSGGGVENLRAIPWVFSWTQSRHVLPAWFGLGSGLESMVHQMGERGAAEAVRKWPFLASMLEDVEMALAKSDLEIAARYAALAPEQVRPVFDAIEQEFRRCVEWLLRLTGTSTLLERDPTLARSIRLRNPYVDPMSLLQVDLLARWRAGGSTDAALLEALFATVNGIARGLQNTG